MSLRVELDKELERKFRELAMRRYGYSKGSIKKATELAIRRWSEEIVKEKPAKKIKDPVELMEGLLVELRGKKTSVELQHEARKLWSKIAED
ncbi:hypothetical protein J4447_05195 [Candidatus Pacearchaeota archaeon]|nr:hypothetical protein [Candidatus Pacearchaeota archaeon]